MPTFVQVKQRLVDYYKTPSGKDPAKEWLSAIKDPLTQAILYKRIRQAGLGQFGKIHNLAGPVALGDVAKAHGISKVAEETGINRRTLYKVFDKNGRPSFDLVTQIMRGLGMQLEVKPKKTKRSKAS